MTGDTSYILFCFQNGQKEVIHSEGVPDSGLLRDHALDLNRAGPQFVRTTLVVPPRSPSQRRRAFHDSVRHALSHLEKQRPNVVFFVAIAEPELTSLLRESEREYDEKYAQQRERIRKCRRLDRVDIKWEVVPAKWRRSIRRNAATGCWIWKFPSAPYRRLYFELKGEPPAGAVLRHKCDNGRCVNPNHLRLGTVRDNNRDAKRARAVAKAKRAQSPEKERKELKANLQKRATGVE